MFKRANKVAALLVAAASVVALVPATGANAAAKRLGNKEGTVKQGIAYDGGAYSYYGFRTDDDLTGIYFNKGGEAKDKTNSDLEDYRFDTLSKYGTQYAYAHEQSNEDEYLVDLKTGEIVSDETKEEKTSKDKTDLVSKLKKANRYNGTDDLTNNNLASFDQVLQGQFGEVWYKYAAYGDNVESVTGAKVSQINVEVLTKAEFEKKANASVVGTGFTDEVAGSTFKYQPVGSAVTTNTAKSAIAYYTDKNGVKQAFNPANLVSTTTAAAVATAGVTTALSYNANGLEGGTLKDQLDDVIADYNAYVKANLTSTGTGTGTGTGNYKTGATAVQKAEITIEIEKFNAKLANVLTTTTKSYVNAGAEVVGSYTDYVDFVQKTIFDKLGSYAGDFGVASPSDITVGTEANTVTLTATAGKIDSLSEKAALESIFGDDFSDATSASNNLNKFYGFTTTDGKYIDASYTANLKVFSQTKGRAVMIDRYDDENKDAEITAHLVSIEAIAQDKDNLYTLTEVRVSGDGAVKDAGQTYGTEYFIQKISKAQGDKEDQAYTPKSVTSYLLDDGIYDDGDLQKPLEVIRGEATEGADEHKYLLGISVKDSVMYVTRAKSDNVKVYKFDLKSSFKADVKKGLNLKTDVDTSAVKWNDASDTDIIDFDFSNVAEDEGLQGVSYVKAVNDTDYVTLAGQTLYRHPAVSIDVNGNTWALDKTKITKFDGLDKKDDIYSVDGAMDAIDVYDDNSLIAWDTTDGERYTTIKEGTNVTEGDGINVNPDTNKNKFFVGWGTDGKFYELVGGVSTAATNKWVSDAGKWYFVDAAGAKKTSWYKNDAGVWYLLGTDGAMLTGWQQDGGAWYYLNPVNTSGAMVTGWFQDTTGTWYYADGNGKMLSNTTVGGYTLGANGAWVK